MEGIRDATLLVVDDDIAFRTRLSTAFRSRGLVVREAGSVADALSVAADFDPEFAIVDLRMPRGSGLELVPQLREVCPGIRIVILTGYGSIATAVDALQRGAAHYLTKPTDVDSILRALFSDRTHGQSPTLSIPSLEQVEWEHINRVLLDCNGNISHAAKAPGIHRRSLQRKLAEVPSAGA